MYSVIIAAAGTGSRMRLGYNKLLYQVAGQTIIEHTVAQFCSDKKCKQMILTVSSDDLETMTAIFDHTPNVSLIIGGTTRQESIYNALELVTEEIVLVHDGARPFVTRRIIDECYGSAVKGRGAIAAVALKDTIKQRDSKRHDIIKRTIPRDELVVVQTPQAFPVAMLKQANRLAIKAGYTGTDDASLVEKYTEIEIKVVEGDYKNIKLTTPDDMEYSEFLLRKR